MDKQHHPSTLEDLTTTLPSLEPPPRRARRRKTWVWLLVLVLLGVGVYFARGKKGAPAASSATSTPAGGRPRGFGAIPVVAARAEKGKIGVYYTGLGAVTPIYTVDVKSVVDGQLMKVYYKEGDIVHQGEPLLEIDPRPFQVQLEQAGTGEGIHCQAP